MFNTKEFWIAVVDLVVSVALYFGAKYLAPEAFEDVKFLIGVLQPFVIMIIGVLVTAKVIAGVAALTAAIRK